MKRLLLVVSGILVAWYVVLATISFLASEETKIRWNLEAMEEAYNRGAAGGVVRHLGDGWRHAGNDVSRRDLQRGLAAEFFQDRDPQSKKLLRRVRLDWEQLQVVLGEGQLESSIPALFERRRGEQWELAWHAELRATWSLLDGDWRVTRSQHVDLSGHSGER